MSRKITQSGKEPELAYTTNKHPFTKTYFCNVGSMGERGSGRTPVPCKKCNVQTTVPATLAECNSIAYPNIFVILQIILVIPVTTASVERANSSLKFLKTALRSSMTNTGLNALIRPFAHRDIDLGKIINDYARAHPRRMQLSRPFGYEETED